VLTEAQETDGSIISPSDANNLVGIKPSVGLTSRDLVIPISEHQDTIGPMARTVKDAAYLLTAIAGYSQYDNYTSAIPYPNYTIPDYVTACDYGALWGKRIGIPRNVFDFPGVDETPYGAIIETFDTYAVPVLEAAGAIIVDNTNWTGYDMDDLNSSSIVLDQDFVTDLSNYLSQLSYNPNNVSNLEEVRAFTQRFALEDFPERDTGVWDEALDTYGGIGNTSPEFWSNYTYSTRLAGLYGLTGSLHNYTLDAIVLPTQFASHFPAILGAPVVTVPMGSFPAGTEVTQDSSTGTLNQTGPGIPFGISFTGPRFSEELLIGLAYAFEQRTHVRDKVLPLPANMPRTEIADVLG
jgi:amidase